MNILKKNLYFSLLQQERIRFYNLRHLCDETQKVKSNTIQTNGENAGTENINGFHSERPILERTLKLANKYVKPRQVWIENLDTINEEKKGLVELHPAIFATMPRLDLIWENIKWQQLYRKVVLFSAKNRAEMPGSGKKPHPQKGLGLARQGSKRSPHMIRGGSAHGPRNPTSYYYMMHYGIRVHGLTSTLSAKFAQDDLHIVENLDIPTDDSQYILDLINERNWGPSVLFVDKNDVMPRNITVATDAIGQITLMPLYGLNVYGMLKHATLVLTLAGLNELEDQLIKVLHTANPLELNNKFNYDLHHM